MKKIFISFFVFIFSVSVYGIQYDFEDGVIKDYTCTNFEKEEFYYEEKYSEYKKERYLFRPTMPKWEQNLFVGIGRLPERFSE